VKVNDNKLEREGIIAGSRRKAGVVAAMGKAGLGLADAFMGKPEKRDHSKSIALQEKLTSSANDIRSGIKPIDFSSLSSTPTNAGGTGASNASTTASSGGNSSVSTIANGAYSGSLDDLSDDDKKWISYTVSSEAAMNTDDEFGVAGVIINRMKSGNYPTSAYDVGHQKGQFEGVQIGNSVHDQKLYDRLFSASGLQKLEGAMTTLDGRDSFKGQALLHNRSSKGNKDGQLDPMFHSSGNYFHHSHQN
jgi:spore germination cell wall hydrolase CwlJ-like protein